MNRCLQCFWKVLYLKSTFTVIYLQVDLCIQLNPYYNIDFYLYFIFYLRIYYSRILTMPFSKVRVTDNLVHDISHFFNASGNIWNIWIKSITQLVRCIWFIYCSVIMGFCTPDSPIQLELKHLMLCSGNYWHIVINTLPACCL